MSLPLGTVTFLFTDIEGSTRLWEEEPVQMGRALARHDEILRSVVSASGGTVFKTIGDAFCASFATAEQAVAAASKAQSALVKEKWAVTNGLRVRMAIHTGPAEFRDEDYFGPPLNRVARLLAAAHGSQIIISAAAQELCRDLLPQGCLLRNLGDHRLKDLGRPETIYQLLGPDLPTDFAPLRTLDNIALPNNLPQQVTSFVGREKELSETRSLIRQHRFLTMTGSGGSGKTRLGLQVAADVLDRFNDGVWLVELAQLSDALLVPQTVAEVLKVREVQGESISVTLVQSLRDKNLLLILDNCEHLLTAVAQLVANLLRDCPRVSILATSREPLGISGEYTVKVPSLSLPKPGDKHDAASLTQFESVRLFVERAVAARPEFRVTNDNAPALASVCYRLDGIPLAIELAAARIRSMTVDELSGRLDDRFRLLTGGSRVALPRQQTLRAMIDWSYDLLDEPQRVLLRRLSVFVGGISLHAAEEICAHASELADDPVEQWDVLDLLSALADKSLLALDQVKDQTRYRLLETVRQYSKDRLAESGESAAVQARHQKFFLDLVELAEPELTLADQKMWFERLGTEYDNIRAAIQFPSEPALGLRLAGALWRFWLIRSYLAEGHQLCSQVLSRAGADKQTVERAKAINGFGVMCVLLGDHSNAKKQFEESLSIRREVNDLAGVGESLNALGNIWYHTGQNEQAMECLVESLEIRKQLGDKKGINVTLNNLGNLASSTGDYQLAWTIHEESLEIKKELGDRYGIAEAYTNLGNLAVQLLNHDRGLRLHQEALRIRIELDDRRGMAYNLEGFANFLVHTHRTSEAVRIWGASEALREELNAPQTPTDTVLQSIESERARAEIGSEAYEAARKEGRTMSLDSVLELTLAE